MRVIFLVIIVVATCSCKVSGPYYSSKNYFPEIVSDLPKGNVFLEVDSMQEPLPQIRTLAIGKFSAEKIIITDTGLNKYSRGFDEKLSEKDSGNVEILINTQQILSVDTFLERLVLYEGESWEDMLERAEKEKSKSKLIKTYPVFIVNRETYPIEMICEDRCFRIIQEAIDDNGVWQPIEFWVHSFCGNSYGSYVIPVGYCAVTHVPIYNGEFKTKLRLKVKIGSNIYYSKPYKGSVNPLQFIKTFRGWPDGSFLDIK